MVEKKEDSSSEEKAKKQRGRPKGSRDSKPRSKKGPAKKKKMPKKASASKVALTSEMKAPVSEPPLAHVMMTEPEARSVSDSEDRSVPIGIESAPLASQETEVITAKPHWSGAALSGDRDLSVPPDVLLQGRKRPQPEVEDILEEPEIIPEHAQSSEFVRPPVKTSLYRKLAIAFAVPVVLLVLVVVYITFAKATVTVYAQRDVFHGDRVITVREEPLGTDEISGEIHEVTVGGEKTGSATDSVESVGVAGGSVALINETSQPYTLVATTRLLTPEGILFRLKNQVIIPADDEIVAEVYADESGASGDIGPSSFTIPGLRAETQEVVYAKSDESMTGGISSRGVVSQDDIEAVEAALREDLVNEAKEDLGSRTENPWTGQEFEVDTMNRFVNVVPGDETDEIVVRLTLRVRSVSYDRSQALEIVVTDLKRGLPSDWELVSVDGDTANIEIERVDSETAEAALRIRLSGESSVSLQSPLFDAEKLKGLDLDAVRMYFESIAGVERVDVQFRPFWIKRMPQLADHIEFKFEK